MRRPAPVALADFLLAVERMRALPPGEPCCTDGSCVLCRAAAEEDHHDAERDWRRVHGRETSDVAI